MITSLVGNARVTKLSYDHRMTTSAIKLALLNKMFLVRSSTNHDVTSFISKYLHFKKA